MYIHMALNTPASLHKLTVLSQLLDELCVHTLAAQNKTIKAAGEPLANAALITTKHVKLERELKQTDLMAFEPAPTPTHPSRDSKGYPLEGFDEVC